MSRLLDTLRSISDNNGKYFVIKMKVYLINPSFDYPVEKKKGLIFNRIWPPMSLAISAAMLENNKIDVNIIDANAERIGPEQILKKIKKPDKIFVTSSSIDRWQCPHLNLEPVYEIIKKIKENFKSELYLLGVHGSVMPDKIFENVELDGIIKGEPEKTILDLCKEKDISKVRGIFIKKKGEVFFTGERKNLKMDDLPFPAYHLLEMDNYEYEIMGKRFALLEASRGCPYSCIFCLKKMYGKYRTKSPEKIKKEIKNLIEKFNIKNLYFFDLEFTLNKKLVEEICDFITKEGYKINWTCQTRFDTIEEELLKKMKKSGCKIIHFGVESGSQKVLKETKKGISKNEIRKKMKLVKKVGIDTVAFFLFGLKGETEKDMEETIKFSKEIDPTYASFHIATPYPGTSFYENSFKNRIFFPEESGEFKKEFLKKKVRKAYKNFYMRPKMIFRLFKIGSLSDKIRLFINFLK